MHNVEVLFSRYNTDRMCILAQVFPELSDLLCCCNELCSVKKKQNADQTSAHSYFRREHVRLINNKPLRIYMYSCSGPNIDLNPVSYK
jgi:hypothetical protein